MELHGLGNVVVAYQLFRVTFLEFWAVWSPMVEPVRFFLRFGTPSDPSQNKGLSRQVTPDGTAGEAFYVTFTA